MNVVQGNLKGILKYFAIVLLYQCQIAISIYWVQALRFATSKSCLKRLNGLIVLEIKMSYQNKSMVFKRF